MLKQKECRAPVHVGAAHRRNCQADAPASHVSGSVSTPQDAEGLPGGRTRGARALRGGVLDSRVASPRSGGTRETRRDDAR